MSSSWTPLPDDVEETHVMGGVAEFGKALGPVGGGVAEP
jgi:hypothetical protein